VLVVASVVALLVTAGAVTTDGANAQTVAAGKPVAHPNIVFILTDDLSMNLISKEFTPHIVDLARRGTSFANYFVSDSLCCPARATIFTGLFPHDTHVVRNVPPDGGFQKFESEELDLKTWGHALQSRGYQTSLLGKYLNGYGDPMNAATAPIPQGWDDWHVSNSTGYFELDFQQNDNGTFNTYDGPENYGVDVLNRQAQSFIRDSAHQPFIVEVSTFIPHAPYTPAPRDANDFPGLSEPRDPSFDTVPRNAPSWLGPRPPFQPLQLAHIDASFRKRVQAMQSVDKLVADTEATLRAEHLLHRTYIVFNSDNGYHLGQHRLERGKQTAFDTDIHVPLIVAGPGIGHGRVVRQVAQNVDLLPTFVDLAGGTPSSAVEGRSLTPVLFGSSDARPWRTVALVEHEHSNEPNDPDYEGGGSNPTSYTAIRVVADALPGFRGRVNAVYVEYDNPQHETEYYDVARDPYELDNVAAQLTPRQRRALHAAVTELQECHSGRDCWQAGRPG
jgi:N-acetylglucosamine-6-sulfatase